LKGTLINVATVMSGTAVGTLLGNRLPDGIRATVMNALGLATVLIGIKTALNSSNTLIILGSLVIGGIVGECLGIDSALARLGEKVEARLAAKGRDGSQSDGRFARGFVTASLLFCVGPMAIMGSIQDGLTGDFSTLAVKATLDGFAALAFSSSLGPGVGVSALSVLIYQGAISMGAGFLQGVLTEQMVADLTATGGLLIVAIGLALLEIKKVRVANLLPAVFIAPLLHCVVGLF